MDFQADGNLVLYDGAGRALWTSTIAFTERFAKWTWEDFAGYCRIAAALKTRIVGGESHYCRNDLRPFFEAPHPVPILQPDPMRGGYTELRKIAAAAEPFRSLINPADPRFVAPDAMPERIAAACRAGGQPEPETPGQFIELFGHPVSRIDFLFLGTISRAGGLFLGATLAIFWRPWLLSSSPMGTRGHALDVVFLAGFGGLLVTVVVFRDVVEVTNVGPTGYDLLFRGGFFFVGLASVAVIAAAVHPTATMTHHLLGNRVMTYIGQRSYGLYLYHWPLHIWCWPTPVVMKASPPVNS